MLTPNPNERNSTLTSVIRGKMLTPSPKEFNYNPYPNLQP